MPERNQVGFNITEEMNKSNVGASALWREPEFHDLIEQLIAKVDAMNPISLSNVLRGLILSKVASPLRLKLIEAIVNSVSSVLRIAFRR